MVKFSCFSAQVHDQKSKKTVAPSTEAMHKSLQDSSQNKFLKNSKSFNAIFSKKGNTQTLQSDMNVTPSSSIEHVRKSDEMLNKYNLETDLDGYLKKKLSVESGLYREGNSSRNSADGAHVQAGPFSEYQEDLSSESLHVSSDLINNESIFSIGDPQNLRKESHENSDISAGKSENHEVQNLLSIPKSCSVPVIKPHVPVQGKSSPLVCSAPRSRSSDDFHVLEMRRIENSIHKIKLEEIHELESDDIMCSKSDKDNYENENQVDEAYDSYNYVGSAKHWIMQDLPSEDFKNKRIEAWVIDLQHCSSLEETDVPCFANDEVKRNFNGLNNPTVSKLDAIVTPGMEAAKRYITSLSPSATTAQLVNHGLVVIPFFSAFVSLKVLNLSGNSIVRITADALPRGLHMLNLSKNNISTIEGLRELTRLRVLDLSYNRIVRIGHGLAFCSSIKELYLAGNKISEVEGFHRLLKLNILDLRFNKISTAKCLRQLAANYNSLQAISLEGNPAQKNVGDEQLKKHVQGLLTHLAYYNRQPIKNSTLQETALKSELKHARKSGHARGRKGQVGVVSTKPPRVRHGLLPPGGTKGTVNVRPGALWSEHRIMNLRQDLSMRRSRSEGTLGAL